jgi:putative CocE/NonD family hydrolase
MIIERAVPMRLADGCRLLADIYRPDGLARVPALLERTPYGRHRCDQAEVPPGGSTPRTREALGRAVVDRGYAFVVQECRGTGGSEGVFEKYVHEADDGAQALAWLAAQPWCDGRVGTMGFSYAATTQLAAASAGAPTLAAMFLDCGGFFDAHASGIRRGGAFEIKQATWAVSHAQRTAQALGDVALAAALAREDIDRWLRDTPWDSGHSPIAALPAQEQQLVAYWRTEAMSSFWRQPALYARGAVDRFAAVPSLLFTTWFDTSLPSTMALWGAMRAVAPAVATRLVVGPWTHGNRHQPWAGDLAFGEAATPEAGFGTDMLQARLAWFDSVFGRATPAPAAPVRLFLMGGGPGDFDAAGRRRHGGRWIDAQVWPPESARPLRWHLQADGSLAPAPTAASARHRFTADPSRPVPTRGGAINGGEPVMAGGAFAHTGAADTPQVLRFETAPLDQALCMAGPVLARLFVSTDGPDADVTIKLLDVYPDGVAYGLSDGILRLSHREPTRAPQPTQPGEVMAIEVEAYPSANCFAAGHRVRVEIAGSNFPRFDLNPNGDPLRRGMAQARVATTTLHTGPAWPSSLELWHLPAP